MAIGRFLVPLNGKTITQNVQQPYVDDIFDPLFNAEVTNYYRNLYGAAAIPAAYASMLDNALTGRKGILGPGMGILSTFGRSMDKADDFILGGLTESVNVLGNLAGGNNETPTNPIRNIFVNDYDYQGTKLMAAMGNAMSRLTGTQTPLTEQDFQTLGDKIAGTTIDLATDPGIMGGQLARLNKGTQVGKMGQILSNYDDVMANIAGNMAFPGGKAMIGKGLNQITDFLSGASSASPIDMVTKHSNQTTIIDPDTGMTTYSDLSPETLTTLKQMSSDITTGIDPINNPDLYALKENIDAGTNFIIPEQYYKDLADYNAKQAESAMKKDAAVKNLKDTAAAQRKAIYDSSFAGMEKHSADFQKGLGVGSDTDPIVDLYTDEGTTSKHLSELDEDEFLQYVRDNFARYDENDWYGNPLEYGKFYDNIQYYVSNGQLDEAKKIVADELEPTLKNYNKSSLVFAPDKMGFQNALSKDSLDLINYHVKKFLHKHPDGLKATFLKEQLGDVYVPTNDVFEPLLRYSRQQSVAGNDITSGKNFSDLLNVLYKKDVKLDDAALDKYVEASDVNKSLIPWIRKNEDVLNKTKVGRDLISLADGLEQDVFDNIMYEDAVKGVGSPSEYFNTMSANRLLNQYLSKTEFSPEDLKAYAEDFPYLDLKVSPDYIKNSKEYLDYVSKRDNLLKKMNFSKSLGMDDMMKYQEQLQALKRQPTDLEQMLEKYYKPAKKDYWQTVRGKPYAYDYTKIKPINVADAAKKILRKPNIEDYVKFSSGLATWNPEDFSKLVTFNASLQDTVSDDLLQKTFDDFRTSWNLPGDMPMPEFETAIKNWGTREQKTLFQQWRAAVQSKYANKIKTRHGALRTQLVKKSKQTIDSIASKYDAAKVSEYITRKDLAEGASIQGDNFLQSIFASSGFKEIPFPRKMPKEQQEAAIKALKYNIEKINKNGNVLVYKESTEGGVRRIAVAFDVDNINIKKDIGKLYGLFNSKNLDLEDVVLREPVLTKTKWDSTELDNAFDEMRTASEALATTLGYKKFSPNYISHAMEDSQEAANMFNKIYKDLGIDKAKLQQICDALREEDIASGKLAFGTIPVERSHLGAFAQYTKGYTTDLKKIHASTFTEGMFDDTNAQTYFDLFLTDNFKIKNNFDDVETLKKALFMKDSSGKMSGNLNNLSIVKPRYDSTGKLVGFTRYNKFSDFELQKAFNDDEAILVPNSVIGSLDRICKKDARMSSKVYRFINKYFTVPFKFGTLANPGFLAGNIQDAYFKQAVELSKKYGTDLGEELTNVAMSMRHVTALNNTFADVFADYREWLKNTDLKTYTRSDRPADFYVKTFKRSKANLDILTPDVMLDNADYRKAFTEYLNTQIPENQRKVAKFYIFLNNSQTTTMFKNNNLDLEDVKNLMNDNPYNVPNNAVERLFYGNAAPKRVVVDGKTVLVPNKGFSSWGLFLNNPVSNGILKSSNTIENWMRSATIINDLQHQGYTMEDICTILDLDSTIERATRNKFKMSMNEAINTMHSANFDYDNVGEFMNKASYILPFPTFYIKNLAFWADIFTNKPQVVDNVISVHEGLWSGKDTSKDEFTAEAKGRGAVPIGQQKTPLTKHLTGIVKQTPYNSMFGAFNAVNNFKEDFAYRTNPVLRPIARHLQSNEDVKYRPYNTNQYQKNIKQGDKEFSNIAYMFHQLNPYERFMNTALRTPGKISKNSYQISDFLPSMVQPDFSKK